MKTLNKNLSLSLLILLTGSLVGCGGSSGSDNATSNEQINTEKPKPEKPKPETSKPRPEIPKPEAVELKDTLTLPSLPLNNKPLDIEANNDGLNDLKTGIFDIDIGRYEDNNPQGYSCTDKNRTYCTFVKQYKLDESLNKVVERHWMYEPALKQWLSVSDGITEDFFYNRYFTGDTLSYNGKWGSRDELTFPDYRSDFKVGAGKLIFDKGSSKYDVIIKAVGLPGGAKRYNIDFILTQGEVITLEDVDFFSGNNQSGDANKYSTLKAYRDAHSKIEDLVCALKLSNSGLVFNKDILGATLYNIQPVCTYAINYNVSPQILEEGVKTVAGKKVIYLNNPTDMSLEASKNTSEQQYLMAIALGSDGVAQMGRAYQPGFGYSLETQIYDRKGIYQYMEITSDDKEALVLPF